MGVYCWIRGSSVASCSLYAARTRLFLNTFGRGVMHEERAKPSGVIALVLISARSISRDLCGAASSIE